ncbi:MAG: hypothetical protein EPO64_08495 [Nitrospirae bacterium]|nr:MAG: hypothetical protein EPO64_08495 [Nitrospirota bacterium]
MARGLRVLVVGALTCGVLVGGLGCTGAGSAERKAEPAGNPALGLLNKEIIRLGITIEQITKRIADLQGMPEAADPTLRELRTLDLASAQLHKQQWILQRDQLAFAKERVRQAGETPSGKPQLLEEWRAHQQQFEAAVEDLRRQRHELERKRVQVEGQLVERALQ